MRDDDDNESIVPYNNFPVLRRNSFPSFDFPLMKEDPLTEIARQRPDAALAYLDRVRRDSKELARTRAKSETSIALLNGFTSIGCQFLARRSESEKHCRVSVDTNITSSFGESFWGSGMRVRGTMQIDIW